MLAFEPAMHLARVRHAARIHAGVVEMPDDQGTQTIVVVDDQYAAVS